MTSSNPTDRLVAMLTVSAFMATLTQPAAAETAETAPPPPLRTLTLRSNVPGTRLQRLAGSADIYLNGDRGLAEVWADLCVAPCDLEVAPDDRLRVAGGAIETTTLDLRPDQDHASVSVRGGSTSERNLGLGLSVLGSLAVVTGAFLIGAASSMEPPSSGPFADPFFAQVNRDQADQASTVRTIGIVALVAGGLGLLIGVPTYVANRTAIKID